MPQRMVSLSLLPQPRSLHALPGTFVLSADMVVLLQDHPATGGLSGAERFILDAEPLTGANFHLARGESVDTAREIRVRHDDSLAPDQPAAIRDQAYALSISPEGIELKGRSAAGIFYAFQTLLQIIRGVTLLKAPTNQKSSRPSVRLPCLAILDHPDFARRGVYHDTARGKVPTVDTLLQLIDDLGHLKYNEFQLYIENNFAFRRHPDMYDDTDPLTAEELLILDEACRARHIDFVPSLSSLGHFEKILSRPRYRPLAEAEPEQLKALGATCWYEAGPWSLAVSDPRSKILLREMYDEFVPNFKSRQFNICCDEAYDLGVVRSKEAAEKAGGIGPLYVEWINYCADLSKNHGKSIQMWGDIILKYPTLIDRLPNDAVLLEWGYEHDHKFDEHCALFAQRLQINRQSAIGNRQSSFYVAPGTSSWLTLSSRTKNAFGNIHNAATAGLKHGAKGILITDWGDNGHQQMLGMSLLPFAYGAAAGWNLAATPNPMTPNQISKIKNQKLNSLLQSISLHLFEDPAQSFATLTYELGLTYERFGWQRFNASVDWFLFREKWDFANYVNRVTKKNLNQVIAATDKLYTKFLFSELRRPHAKTLREEFIFTCGLILHTCHRTLMRQAWLAADPAIRNPEEPALRTKRRKRLPKDFQTNMRTLAGDIRQLRAQFEKLWLARNKPSRLVDIRAEFTRRLSEYRRYEI